MFDFHQKRKIRGFLGSRITQGILLVIALFVMLSAYNRYLIARDMAERRETAEVEVRALEKRRESLSEEVKYLSNERGQEAEMRRQFDIARDGEQVVIILDDDSGDSLDLEKSTVEEPIKRAWYRFW
jgi:cell division protein FtsB